MIKPERAILFPMFRGVNQLTPFLKLKATSAPW